MNLRALPKIRAPNKPINSHCPVTFPVARPYQFPWRKVLETVNEKVGMGVAKNERSELHDPDEA